MASRQGPSNEGRRIIPLKDALPIKGTIKMPLAISIGPFAGYPKLGPPIVNVAASDAPAEVDWDEVSVQAQVSESFVLPFARPKKSAPHSKLAPTVKSSVTFEPIVEFEPLVKVNVWVGTVSPAAYGGW